MNIEKCGKNLLIDGGLLYPKYEIPLNQIRGWKFVAEENGATFLAFNYAESTQHVSIDKMDPDELLDNLIAIEKIVGVSPELEISEVRITKEQLVPASDVLTAGILGAILASAAI